jgi:prepilin signal peptidase PulO-like enzyme (type II secretory pathway)
MRLSLDWMNLFGGLDSHQVVSVLVVAVIFTAAAGLTVLSLIAFGVRSGIMAPAYSTRVPLASDVELGAFLGGAAFGMISILLMTFLGFAENDLDNPLFLPLAVGPILLGGLFLVSGAGLAFRTVRRRRTSQA